MRRFAHFFLLICFQPLFFGCATTNENSEQAIAFVGVVTKVAMWRPTQEEWTEHWIRTGQMLDPKRKSASDEDDVIIVTNSCGMTTAEFDVYSATIKIDNKIPVKATLGEWCRPKFEYQEEYFVITKGHEIILSQPIYYTINGEMVIEANEADLNWFRRESKLPLAELKVENFQSPALDTSLSYTKDPDIIEYVEHNEEWEIRIIDGEERVVLTKGVLLKRMFPELAFNSN